MDHALELGAFAAFNYKQEDFSQKVLKATKGKGVNLILERSQSHPRLCRSLVLATKRFRTRHGRKMGPLRTAGRLAE